MAAGIDGAQHNRSLNHLADARSIPIYRASAEIGSPHMLVVDKILTRPLQNDATGFQHIRRGRRATVQGAHFARPAGRRYRTGASSG